MLLLLHHTSFCSRYSLFVIVIVIVWRPPIIFEDPGYLLISMWLTVQAGVIILLYKLE